MDTVERLEEVCHAAEGLEALQKEIATFNSGKPPISWEEFKSFVNEGRQGRLAFLLVG